MNARIALRLWLAVILFGTEALVWTFAAHSADSQTGNSALATAANVLPAIELPTVTVHPDPVDSLPDAEDSDNATVETPALDPAASRLPALPQVRLSLPYYSFGKLLPRVHKD